MENSRVGDSKSNGKIERAVRNIKNSIRTHRCFIEMATGNKVKVTDPVLPWIVRQAGYVQTRCNISDDGKDGMGKDKGKEANYAIGTIRRDCHVQAAESAEHGRGLPRQA